jgi:tetratricopeptide (TPR) repeat protein
MYNPAMNQPTLRLTQYSKDNDRFVINIRLEVPHEATQTVDAEFTFALTAQDRENMRWYLENYLQYPLEPNPAIAHRIEVRLKEVGVELFQRLFDDSRQATRLWGRLVGILPQTRVEIVTEVAAATAIPWELLRDPETDKPLAITAHTFVRSYSQAAQPPALPRVQSGDKIRVLLVIARPQAGNDVPFRSVAIPLLKGFGQDARQYIQLDVLRPPTYPTFADTLRQAHANGQPYHVVHFDGHGTYTTPERAQRMGGGEIMNPHVYGDPNQPHGFLLFENPDHDSNAELIDGVKLGQLLADCGVPVLILNACKSAYAETELGSGPPEVGQHPEMVRQFGSLAQIIMNAGVAGVVAMAYNVYVVTAAQFVAKLYEALRQGQPLGTAVSQGRKNLYDAPQRAIAFDPLPLQDWSVPIVYEAASLKLFTPQATTTLAWQPGQPLADGFLDEQLPGLPDVGEFIGRHETLLALDRAFDSQKIVLLYGGAGSGKTTASAEFAHWYSLTGGLGRQPVVLFSSFERTLTLPRLLDKVGQVFGSLLEQSNIHWLTLDDSQRRTLTLQLFQQLPVLWLWDNVEPVAGFPAGADTPWSHDEQQELVAFLRACASQTRARFLLTSRRDEQGWLGGLPRHIPMSPMPLFEMVELARNVAQKHGYRLTNAKDWFPLLRFSQGNPMTLTIVTNIALREGRSSAASILEFVRLLRAGEVPLDTDNEQGRDKSLGASLSYGFTHAFNETERRILALLHLFQGFVDVDVLGTMGNRNNEWSLPELHGPSRRDRAMILLDRAAEIGLLTSLGGGYYRIHPALPWYFHDLFQQSFAADSSVPAASSQSPTASLPTASSQRLAVIHAYTQAIAAQGDYYHDQYGDGNRDVIALLTAEEANLRQARALARRHGWHEAVIKTMQGLDTLYGHTGRRGEWARLVQEMVPDFVDPATDGPRQGIDGEVWRLVIEYQVGLYQVARQWHEAERLQRIRVNWERDQSAAALDLPPDQLTANQRNQIRSLAMSVGQLGQIQEERGEPTCASSHEDAFHLCQRIGDNAAAANVAVDLGYAYMDLPALRDLDQAETWFRRGLDLRPAGDRQGQGQSYVQLGTVAHQWFKDARKAGANNVALFHLNATLAAYQKALTLLPSNAVNDLAVAHNQLGEIYRSVGDLPHALPHYQESIRYEELQGNLYGAGQTRHNVALALAQAGRLRDALLYAQAALRNFETYGARAQADIDDTEQLIADIQQAMAAGS